MTSSLAATPYDSKSLSGNSITFLYSFPVPVEDIEMFGVGASPEPEVSVLPSTKHSITFKDGDLKVTFPNDISGFFTVTLTYASLNGRVKKDTQGPLRLITSYFSSWFS